MKAVINDLKRRTFVGEIVPFLLDQAIEDYNYDSFEIGSNLHNRCVKNVRSAGDQWEKNHPLEEVFDLFLRVDTTHRKRIVKAVCKS